MPSEPLPAVPPSLPPAAPRTPPPSGGAPAVPNTDETMFFQRRAARKIHLLPSLVLAAVVLGSGALVTWALTRKHTPAEAVIARPADPFAGQPILSPEEGRRAANPPLAVSTAAPVDSSTPAVGKPAPEVRRALPVEGNLPPSSSFEEANAAPLNISLTAGGENAQVKAEVLARVDLMPEVSQDNKDKLYAAVDRARGMGRMIALPFDKGRNTVSDADVEKLRRRAQAPDIKRFTDDPTVVFVVLGYADPKGDPKVNYQLSLQRARSVMDALRDRCGFQNVMHAVAMGGSTLFGQGQKEADKNRVVEIWAVLP